MAKQFSMNFSSSHFPPSCFVSFNNVYFSLVALSKQDLWYHHVTDTRKLFSWYLSSINVAQTSLEVLFSLLHNSQRGVSFFFFFFFQIKSLIFFVPSSGRRAFQVWLYRLPCPSAHTKIAFHEAVPFFAFFPRFSFANHYSRSRGVTFVDVEASLDGQLRERSTRGRIKARPKIESAFSQFSFLCSRANRRRKRIEWP